MASRASVLIIDGDGMTRATIAAGFVQAGCRVTEATDLPTAFHHLEARLFDLVVMDPGPRDIAGHPGGPVEALRAVSDCGLIVLSAAAGREQRLGALDRGADDFLAKPVDLAELLARSRAVLRRCGPARAAGGGPIQVFAGWHLDLLRRELTDAQGRLVRLTRAEFDLVAALAQAKGQTLTRDYLIEVVCDAESDAQVRTVDAMVSRVRRKLAEIGGTAAPGIVTVHGIGYRFTAPQSRP